MSVTSMLYIEHYFSAIYRTVLCPWLGWEAACVRSCRLDRACRVWETVDM